MLQTIDSDTPFDVVFLYFWETGDNPYWDGSRKSLTCLDFITGFGIVAATGLKKITSDQAAQWNFGNFFVPIWLPQIIVVDADRIFDIMFKKNFQETLLIPINAAARGN